MSNTNASSSLLPHESTPLLLASASQQSQPIDEEAEAPSPGPDHHHETDTPDDDYTMSQTLYWRIGAAFGASAVAIGAFGAHGLKKHITDPQKLANFATAAQYQLIHSGATMLAAGVGSGNPLAAGLFTAGMTMFSGSLYALVLDTERFRFLGPVTPIGGVCLIAGWAALGIGRRGAFPRLR